MSEKPINNSTIARIAGNIAAGYISKYGDAGAVKTLAALAVEAARAIVAEVEHTEPGGLPHGD